MGRYSAQKWGGGGVSRGLGCTYLKGITIHEESEGQGKNDVLVECEVVGGLGKRNVVLRAWTPNKNTKLSSPNHPKRRKSFKIILSSIFPIPIPQQNFPSTIPQNPKSNQSQKKTPPSKLTPTPPGTMKRRTGEVLAICEHSKVNIAGVELPGSKEKKEKKEGKGKESKL
ncbi:hypothetical protein BCON_0047g00180 [Botryotinia convoluta]|uniref:Uncharacterized protein n=1 Tax=Botryotinia convoluta TaxID=54673 RepID=A0A4Z1IJ05_9HELO|nr:hypothetical protein BCON_0047g00180 [Botryotinia convoluta]